MTGLDDYLDEYGRTLAGAEPPPRRRIWFAGAVAVAAAVVFVALLVAPGEDRRLSTVAQARAALNPQSGIFHLVVSSRTEIRNPTGHLRSSVPALVTEQWSTANPPRYRVLVRDPARRSPTAFDYRDGRATTIVPGRPVRITSGLSDRGADAGALGVTPLGVDPVARLRSLLATGDLRDAGPSSVDGRKTRRLVGTPPDGPAGYVRRFTYDVDPDTFTPVAATLQLRGVGLLTGRGKRGRFVQDVPATHLRFQRFERLPLTPDNERLLRVTIPPDARIVLLDLKHRGVRGGISTCEPVRPAKQPTCRMVRRPR